VGEGTIRTNTSRGEVMSRLIVVLVFVFLGCLIVAGCTSSDEPAVKSEPEPLDEKTAAAARTRGVITRDREEAVEAKPQAVLSKMTYEWRTSPERGMHVTLDFTNPADTYERARGYVFLIAEATRSGSLIKGVYPWNTSMDGDLPEDHTDGTHLLYRERQQVRAFLPYPRSDGHFETLRLYVFHENGKLLTNRTYELDFTGAPGEKGTVNPGFDL
jgi:hypothetical protein